MRRSAFLVVVVVVVGRCMCVNLSSHNLIVIIIIIVDTVGGKRVCARVPSLEETNTFSSVHLLRVSVYLVQKVWCVCTIEIS